MDLTRVSSSFTIFLKIFIPTTWIVFFGILTLFILFAGSESGIPNMPGLKIGTLIFFASGVVLLWLTLMKLKRVEMADDHFFVTNYFKTFRYTYDSLTKIQEWDLLILTIVIFTFTSKGSFGKKISFVSRGKVWRNYVDEHPESFSHLIETAE